MKKKILLSMIAICLSLNLMAQQAVENIAQSVKKDWGIALKDVNNLTPQLLSKIENEILEKNGIKSLNKESKNDIKFISSVYKTVELWRYSLKNKPFDLACLNYLKKLNLDNSVITKFENQYVNILESYYIMLYKVTGVDIADETAKGIVNSDDKVKDLLKYKNKKIAEQLISHYFEIEKRYAGYREWMNNPLLKSVVTDKKKMEEIEDFAKQYNYLKIGGIAPDFKIKDTEGNFRTLSEFKGKVVVIDVWGTWCSGCIKAMPHFLELFNHYKNNKDIVFITISNESENQQNAERKWRALIDKLGISEMICLMTNTFKSSPSGADFIKNYNIMGAPRYFIINKEGKFESVYYPFSNSPLFTELIEKSLAN